MKKSSRLLWLALVGLALLLEIDFSAAPSQVTSKSVTKKPVPAELKWTDIPDVKGAKQAYTLGRPQQGGSWSLC